MNKSIEEKYGRYLLIDPGTIESGLVEWNVSQKSESGGYKFSLGHRAIMNNNDILERFKNEDLDVYDHVIIENVASYGMPVGQSTFTTCIWIGRFYQHFNIVNTYHVSDVSDVKLMYRKEAKKTISSGKAKDSEIRRRILDYYPRIGGGSTPEIGTKKEQGPLYGVKSHMFAALALGHAYLEGANTIKII